VIFLGAFDRLYSLAPEIVVERIGDDVIVMDSSSAQVSHLTGQAAEVVWSVANNIPLSKMSDAVVRQLMNAGIVNSSSEVYRRTVLGMGAMGLGATVTALTLPAVAAASSVVTLSGIWANDTGTGRFFAVIDSTPDTDPGPLSVPGGTATYQGVKTYQSVIYLYWRQLASTPPDNASTVGTFTWNGLSYRVNLAYNLSLAQDIVD
jgi:hypothetical protein